MKPKAGDVILVPFPFTDNTGTKVRPAVVVSKKTYGEDVVIVFVTSQYKRRGVQVVSVTPTATNGLRQKSSIVCSKLASLKTSLIIGGLGRLSAKERAKVKQALATVLGV